MNKHDDRARVDDHLDRGEQLRVLEQEQHRHAHEREDEPQRGVHRVARQHDSQRAGQRERREGEEEEDGHECASPLPGPSARVVVAGTDREGRTLAVLRLADTEPELTRPRDAVLVRGEPRR